MSDALILHKRADASFQGCQTVVDPLLLDLEMIRDLLVGKVPPAQFDDLSVLGRKSVHETVIVIQKFLFPMIQERLIADRKRDIAVGILTDIDGIALFPIGPIIVTQYIDDAVAHHQVCVG